MRLLYCLVVTLLLAGCGNDSPLASVDADVTGTWQGPIAIGGQRTTLRLSIFQHGFDLTGNWAIGETGGSLGGQVSGVGVLLSLRDASPCIVNLTATVIEKRMTGTFAAATTGCGTTAAGSLELSRL